MTFPNSSSQVVSTVALVLAEYIKAVREEISNVKVVYDEQLSFESGATAHRANNRMRKEKLDLIPAFLFNRSVLRYCKDGMGRRSVTSRVRNRLDTKQTSLYRQIQAEFDINFLYVCKTMEDFERFEIAYLSEEGISEDKTLLVQLPDGLGELEYFLTPEPLEDKMFEMGDNYFKGISGKINIHGTFLVFRENSPHINSIHLRIKEFNDNILYEQTVP